jgi:hypothetical protein
MTLLLVMAMFQSKGRGMKTTLTTAILAVCVAGASGQTHSNALTFKATQTAVMLAFHSQTEVTVLHMQACAPQLRRYGRSLPTFQALS